MLKLTLSLTAFIALAAAPARGDVKSAAKGSDSETTAASVAAEAPEKTDDEGADAQARRGPREAAGAFLRALARGKYDDAYAQTTAAYRKAHPQEKFKQGFTGLSRAVDLSKLKVERALATPRPAAAQAAANGPAPAARAAVVTAFVSAKEAERKLAFGLGLENEGGRWLVRDVDLLPNEDVAGRFIGDFRKANPTAAPVPVPEEKRAE